MKKKVSQQTRCGCEKKPRGNIYDMQLFSPYSRTKKGSFIWNALAMISCAWEGMEKETRIAMRLKFLSFQALCNYTHADVFQVFKQFIYLPRYLFIFFFYKILHSEKVFFILVIAKPFMPSRLASQSCMYVFSCLIHTVYE